MIPERAKNETEDRDKEKMEPERPMPREKLDTPEMRAKIAKAKERARAVEDGSGKTADDLLELAREQRRVDTRT